jgi:sorbitol/mannitol transport system permease protein
LIWKNFILHPDYGLIAFVLQKFGLRPIAWFTDYPLLSIIIIVAWEWLPFAFLILFTSLKSLDHEQKEAASIDGANPIQLFFYIIVPHLQRAIGVVVMIETIFLLSIFERGAYSPDIIFMPTLESFKDVFARSNYLAFVMNSLYVSIGSTLVCFLFAIPAAYKMSFFPTLKTNQDCFGCCRPR